MKGNYIFIIVLILLFFCIGFSLYKYDNYQNENTDIVITWVNDDEEFINERDHWLQKENILNKNKNENRERYENHQELKYCLRSIEMYYPYYNNIYLVVKDGQFPEYLKQNHPKLKVINHSEIIPKEYLPTFNSCAIEAYIHHIPNLSENYLYFNDDFMLLQKLQPSFYIDKNNIPYSMHISRHKHKCKGDLTIKKGEYNFTDGWCFNNNLLDKITNIKEKRYYVAHIPKMFNKKLDFEIENRLKNIYIDPKINCYDKTGMSRFRLNDNLFLVVMIKYYLYIYWYGGKFKETKVADIRYNKKYKYDEKIKKDYPFLCIADVHTDSTKEYFLFMDKLYPTKSSFEL